MLMNLLLFIGAFGFMEFVAWSNHKYIMHGFLWSWHKDHHINDQKRGEVNYLPNNGFEKNDIFFLIYAIPAILLMMFGFFFQINSFLAISFGITLYGLTYFTLHDVLIHHRFNISFLKENNNRFFKAVIKAHTAHHRPLNVIDFNNYGLLVFSIRYFKD